VFGPFERVLEKCPGLGGKNILKNCTCSSQSLQLLYSKEKKKRNSFCQKKNNLERFSHKKFQENFCEKKEKMKNL